MIQSVDRRNLFKLGLIGTALAAPQIMVRAAFAAAPAKSDVEEPGFRRFNLGSFEVTTILDGKRPGDGPHPTFGADQPAETVRELMEENFLPADRFVNMFTPTVINTGSELVLFDTGLGEAGRANGLGKLRARLEASGYQAGDVSIVVLTHMHGDHIGGLMDGGNPAFPNARYVAGQAEWDFWTAPERMNGPTANGAKAVETMVKPLEAKMTFLGDGDAVTQGITGMAAFGHTPGHMIFRIESDGRPLVLTADTSNHFVASLQRPDWEVSFDTDKAMAAQTRKTVFGMLASERIPFIGYHMPHPAIGFVEAMDTGFRFVPASYQFDL